MAASGTGAAEFVGERLACRRGERPVFEALAFRLAPGGALLLTGPNGAGKSSLLRLMAGLLAPAGGRLLWAGVPVRDDPDAHRGRVAYLGHRDAVKPNLTLVENLSVWASLQGCERDAATGARIRSALSHFGLERLADLPARYLSAGQRRRLALARLPVAARPLWLLDEPHAALDGTAVAALERAIASHRAGGGMVAVASHGGLDLDAADALDLAAAMSVAPA